MDFQTLMASLAKRKSTSGTRVNSLSVWLKILSNIYGAKSLAKAAGIPVKEMLGLIETKSGILTYSDEKCAGLTGITTAKDRDNPEVDSNQPGAGTSDGEGDSGAGSKGSGLSTGSIMDFDCIITTGRRDRDGDVLEPKGAILDPKMPLLWQHMPFQPLGRIVKTLEQTDQKVSARFMIADTALGQDAVKMIEADILRISHGFAPIEYNPLKDDQGKDMGGWRISKYAMMETSLVSIPSNIDAEILQFTTGKFAHPLIKGWGEILKSMKSKIFTGGIGSGTKTAKKTTKKPLPVAGKKPKDAEDEDEKDQDEEEEDEEETDQNPDEDQNIGLDDGSEADEDQNEEQSRDDNDASADDKVEDEDSEETDDEDDPEPDTNDPDQDGDSQEDTDGDGDGTARPLGDIIASVQALSKVEGMSREGAKRAEIVQAMLEDVESGIDKSSEALAEAAKSRDLVGMYTSVSELTENCLGHLQRSVEELDRLHELKDLPPDAVKAIESVLKDANSIISAVSAVTGKASGEDEYESGGDEDGDQDEDEINAEREMDEDDVDDKDDDESLEDEDEEDLENEDADEVAEVDSKDDEDEDTEDAGDMENEDEEDEDAKDADEDEEKGRDDEDTPRDEDPENELEGKPNPGVNDAGNRNFSEILGRALSGKPTTKAERKLIRQKMGRILAD